MAMSIEERLRKLEDAEAIRRLRHTYASHANIVNGRPGDLEAFSQLFTATAEWDVGLGLCVGSRAIKEGMLKVTTQWQCVMHVMMNEIIEVEGDRGTGTWTGLFPFVSATDQKPVWSSLIYHDEYVRTGEGWKFQSVRVTSTIVPPEFAQAYAEVLGGA